MVELPTRWWLLGNCKMGNSTVMIKNEWFLMYTKQMVLLQINVKDDRDVVTIPVKFKNILYGDIYAHVHVHVHVHIHVHIHIPIHIHILVHVHVHVLSNSILFTTSMRIQGIMMLPTIERVNCKALWKCGHDEDFIVMFWSGCVDGLLWSF